MSTLKGACIIGQSGGPTSVINASAYGCIKTALENENITKEINRMIEDFQYTVPSMDTKAKELEKKIKKEFDRLANMLEQTDCDEAEVVNSIRLIRRTITDISSLH